MKLLARLLLALFLPLSAGAASSYVAGFPQGTATAGLPQGLNGGAVTTAAPTYSNGVIQPFTMNLAGGLRVDGSGVTQPISGTITANQGGAPWSDNVAQFGGVAVNTGTGASGTGTPRVTVANDSNILATESGTWTVQPGNTANTTPWLFQDNVSNAADAVATGSISVPTISYQYAFNGTTWDREQDDAFKSLKVLRPDQAITGQGSQTALNNNIILATAGAGSTATTGYHSWSIQIVVSAGTVTAGNITFEGSNDNANWQAINVFDQAAMQTAPVSTYAVVAATNRYFKGPLNWGFVRARISTGLTGTNTGVQASTVFSQDHFTPDEVQVASSVTGNNLGTTTIASGTVTTVTTVTTASTLNGGPTAAGSASANNPNQVGGVDSNGTVRKILVSPLGAVQDYGSSENVTPFAVGTGAAAVTDGTNGKTINLLPGKEGDVYLYVSSISTAPTIECEISYANSGDYAIIPMTRIDNTAASQQFASVAAFTPVAGAVYRGKTYGADILRVHLVAGSASNTTGEVRVQYQPEMPGVFVAPFAFQASGTTEAVGSANGQVYTGSVRTIVIPTKGSNTLTAVFEANTGGSNVVAIEGSQDNGTTWNALTLQPLPGGATVSNFTNTGTAALPGAATYQVDISNQIQVRAHCSTFTSGVVYGYLKLVNVPSANAPTSRHPSYSASVGGAVTATTNVLAIISGASKTTTVKRITVIGGFATSATVGTLTLVRGTVAAPAGGTAVTAATMQHNPSDGAFSGSVLQGISSAITVAGMTSTNTATAIPALVSTSALGNGSTVVFDLTDAGQTGGYQIPVGATNSLLLSWTGTAGGTAFNTLVDFTEE